MKEEDKEIEKTLPEGPKCPILSRNVLYSASNILKEEITRNIKNIINTTDLPKGVAQILNKKVYLIHYIYFIL